MKAISIFLNRRSPFPENLAISHTEFHIHKTIKRLVLSLPKHRSSVLLPLQKNQWGVAPTEKLWFSHLGFGIDRFPKNNASDRWYILIGALAGYAPPRTIGRFQIIVVL
jgi:hypothetical protein